MSDEEVPEDELFGSPSYLDWLNEQNAKLDAEDFPPLPVRRGWHIAGETPLKFFTAVAYRAGYDGTRKYLRRQNRRAVRKGEDNIYLAPEQMELPQVQAFLLANFDRRLADVRAERRVVEEWCASHSGYTSAQVYRLAGVAMPAIADDAS